MGVVAVLSGEPLPEVLEVAVCHAVAGVDAVQQRWRLVVLCHRIAVSGADLIVDPDERAAGGPIDEGLGYSSGAQSAACRQRMTPRRAMSPGATAAIAAGNTRGECSSRHAVAAFCTEEVKRALTSSA